MSYPVFLSSSLLPRMPEGSRNEWHKHFSGNSVELEANGFFPFFWRVLFTENDIRYARFIDEFDICDRGGAVCRNDYLSELGTEGTYPYLITNHHLAVSRLDELREKVLEAVGEQFRQVYESFEMLVRQHFPDYILLRTSCLPDMDSDSEMESWLKECVTGFDRLYDNNHLNSLLQDLELDDVDPVWVLTGTCSEGRVWPTQTLRENFPALENNHIFHTPQKLAQNRIYVDSILDWSGILLTVGTTLGVYVVTESESITGLAFLIAGGGWWGAIMTLRNKSRR